MKPHRKLITGFVFLSLLAVPRIFGATPDSIKPVLLQTITNTDAALTAPAPVPDWNTKWNSYLASATSVATFNEWVFVGSYSNGYILTFERDMSNGQMQFRRITEMYRHTENSFGSLTIRVLADGNAILYSQYGTEESPVEATLHWYHVDASTGNLTFMGSCATALQDGGWPFPPAPGTYGYAGYAWNPSNTRYYKAYVSNIVWVNFLADGTPQTGGSIVMEHPYGGSWRPRLSTVFSQDARHLYVLIENQNGDNWQIDQYNVDAATGIPSYVSSLQLSPEISKQGWMRFLEFTPDGRYLCMACPLDAGGGYLVTLQRDNSSGALSVVWQTNDDKIQGLLHNNWQPATFRFNANGESGYYTSVGWANAITLYPFTFDDATGALTIYDGISGWGAAFNLDTQNGFMYWGANPLYVYKTPGAGNPLPFDLNCTDPVKLTADSGAANPQTVITILHTIDTAAVPSLTATTDSAWFIATVSGNGVNQTVTVTANIAGRPSGIYLARLTVAGSGYTYKRKRFVELRINGTPIPKSLAVTPARDTIMVGDSAVFIAAVRDQFNSAFMGAPLTWSVSAGGTVNSAGLFKSDGNAGLFTIRCSLTGNSAVFAEATVMVKPFTITGIPGGTVSAEFNDSPGAEGISNVIDGNTNTKFLTFNASAWIQFCAPKSCVVTGYTLTSANDAPERDPKDWTLEGSNDGTTWTPLDSKTSEAFSSRFQTKTYLFTNTTAFTCYRLSMTNNSGTTLQLAEWELLGAGASIQNNALASVTSFSLSASPNPFSALTRISYALPLSQKAAIRVYDISGRLVKTLANGKMDAGRHLIVFDGQGENGRVLMNGMYFCRMQTQGFEKTEKLMLIR